MYDKRNLRNAWSRPLLFSLSVKMEVLILALISITTKKKKLFSRQDTIILWWHWRSLQWQAVEAKHGTCTGDLPPLETLRWAFGFDDNTPIWVLIPHLPGSLWHGQIGQSRFSWFSNISSTSFFKYFPPRCSPPYWIETNKGFGRWITGSLLNLIGFSRRFFFLVIIGDDLNDDDNKKTT